MTKPIILPYAIVKHLPQDDQIKLLRAYRRLPITGEQLSSMMETRTSTLNNLIVGLGLPRKDRIAGSIFSTFSETRKTEELRKALDAEEALNLTEKIVISGVGQVPWRVAEMVKRDNVVREVHIEANLPFELPSDIAIYTDGNLPEFLDLEIHGLKDSDIKAVVCCKDASNATVYERVVSLYKHYKLSRGSYGRLVYTISYWN